MKKIIAIIAILLLITASAVQATDPVLMRIINEQIIKEGYTPVSDDVRKPRTEKALKWMREQCYNAIEQKYGVIKPSYTYWKPKLQKIARLMTPADIGTNFRYHPIEMWTIKIETTYMDKMEPWEDIKELKDTASDLGHTVPTLLTYIKK